ncbi:MAG: EF2563 family selenium-dependent molybdenum hydroxylase system protein [Desulfarculus sp.]|nr:EF2563 family selenium-dependent molybdenum hydroxylase system protein [Desulfarculus sp.]
MKLDLTVLIKGAGEMASGVAFCLHQAHLRVALSETREPLAVRRAVSFCEAVHLGRMTVEGVTAVLVKGLEELGPAWAAGQIPLLVDPALTCLPALQPQVLVEATLNKQGLDLDISQAPLVIALGPGFEAGVHAHLVVETNRGHDLGRLYAQGQAQANTGVPGQIGGLTWQRVLRAPAAGVFKPALELGARVAPGQEVARVAGQPLLAGTGGLLRGLLRPGTTVHPGQKVGDIDPRDDPSYLRTISEKARALGGAVLLAIMQRYNR